MPRDVKLRQISRRNSRWTHTLLLQKVVSDRLGNLSWSFMSHRGVFWIRRGASASVNSTKASRFLFSASFFSYPGIHAVGALASSPALDGVDRKVLGQGAREGGVVSSHGEDAGNNENRWPASHGEIANPGPIPGAHDLASPDHLPTGLNRIGWRLDGRDDRLPANWLTQ